MTKPDNVPREPLLVLQESLLMLLWSEKALGRQHRNTPQHTATHRNTSQHRLGDRYQEP